MEGTVSSRSRGQKVWQLANWSFVLFLSLWQIRFVSREVQEIKIELRSNHYSTSTSITHGSNYSSQESAHEKLPNISSAVIEIEKNSIRGSNANYSSQEPEDEKMLNISSADSDIDKNIVIRLTLSKGDRLASNIERPLYLMAYAHCYRQTFCIKGRFSSAMEYFPGMVDQSCPKGLEDRLGRGGNSSDIFANPPLQKPGVYDFRNEDRGMIYWMDNNLECAFDDSMRQKWRKMILDAASEENPKAVNSTLLTQQLFERADEKVVTVAIQIRRGDYSSVGRELILDQHFVILLRHLRSILEKAKRTPEVHLFSEDYGMIDTERNITRNWTMYEGLVDHYHFAPDMRKQHKHTMDMDLNLRDWRHFLEADILVAASHFSFTPSLGRWKPPDPETGLPLTIHNYKSTAKILKTKDDVIYNFGWSEHDYGKMPDQYSLDNLPPALAKHDTVPVETFMKDLMEDWNATYNN